MLITDFSQQAPDNHISPKEIFTAGLIIIMPVIMLLVLTAQ